MSLCSHMRETDWNSERMRGIVMREGCYGLLRPEVPFEGAVFL